MKATLKTLMTALLSVATLAAGANAYADRDDRDGWRDGGRYEYRWDDRRPDRGWHEGWRHHRHPHYVYRDPVYFYAPPPVVYPGRVIYGPVYREPGPAVIIDLPPIVIR